LKEKSKAFGVFKKFKVFVEKQSGFYIKVFRSDRGGEFTSTTFNSFCEEHDIRRHLTAPYSPPTKWSRRAQESDYSRHGSKYAQE
jgi:transposase InsO family protein